MSSQIIIKGGNRLEGKIPISGSKNASLPILASSILVDGKVTISNLPHLADISTMFNLLFSFGAKVNFNGFSEDENQASNSITIDNSNLNSSLAHYDIVSKMRASVFVLGPLLARFGEAKVSLPGGCAIGARPVNLHLMAMESLGAEIKLEDGYIIAKAKDGLKGAEIEFPMISVGATENAIMAASLAQGKTIIKNAAIEPEIIDLVNFLKNLGADIKRKGREFEINGKDKLESNKEYRVSADRIEAGSYAVAAIATKGEVILENIEKDILDPIKNILISCGAKLSFFDNQIKVKYDGGEKSNILVETAEYPGFPTDMQPQFASLLAVHKGNSSVSEKIFENRFMNIPELNRMGAEIEITDNKLTIPGNKKLSGAEVTATDLRAAMALVISGLVAEGETKIKNLHFLDRGYENLEEKLSKCGANIRRVRVAG